MRVGLILLEGPSAIFPPQELDGYGWLEADFRLTIKWPGQVKQESVSVFSDDSINREENFLEPMIRHCIWNRSADMADTNPWPSASVSLGHVRDQSKVDAVLRDVHRSLSGLPFAELGLSTQRDVADLELDPSEPEFQVWARNGVQSIEYWSLPVAAAKLGLSFRQVYEALLAELVPVAPSGWRERYDYDLREEPRSSWELPVGANPSLEPTSFGKPQSAAQLQR